MVKNPSKKSTSKYSGTQKQRAKKRAGGVPLIIPVIAVVEVIVLIAVSTFAWYKLNVSKTLSTGVITVNADAGLDIDFRYADDKTYIDIWDYIGQDFAFEPASSIDGRNIYFPTTGTFESTNTTGMTFRDATVNDINTKYINIDFELTNTSGDDMDVYLSSKSHFKIKENNEDNTLTNGSALRLAFYNNDGMPGKVASTMMDRMTTTGHNTYASTVHVSEASDDTVTLFFYRPNTNFTPYAYIWATNDTSGKPYYKAWPGVQMTKVSGNLYSVDVPKTADGKTFDKVIFSNSYSGDYDKSKTLTISNGKVYDRTDTENSSGQEISFKIVYFLKPTGSGWAGMPKCDPVDDSTLLSYSHFFEDGSNVGEEMTEITTGIYYYIIPSGFNDVRFTSASGGYTQYALVEDQKLYYATTTGENPELATTSYSEGNIYFFNTYNWTQPYALVNAFPAAPDEYTYSIPMVKLSGNVYFCSVPTPYLKDKVSEDVRLSSNAGNCRVFFSSSMNKDDTTSRTELADCQSDYIYRPLSDTDSSGYYQLETESYNAGTSGATGYAIISPGVSAGFQRLANPVNSIDMSTGAVQSILPTFANSFDDYIYGSHNANNQKNPVFTIGQGKTVSMSMIIWLEGTDVHCTGENYAAKMINLYLEFITEHKSFGGEDQQTAEEAEKRDSYYFIDKTATLWTSNAETFNSYEISPVMQLYDVDNNRGYLMTASHRDSAKNKVDEWHCSVPTSVRNDKHKIEFRRVNPYDEEEIWNRWQAGEMVTDAISGSTASGGANCYFTAFADGSPNHDLYGSGANAICGLPERSCGGLWGDVEVEQLVVYDGRGSTTDGLDSSDKRITIRYDYTYPQAGGNPVTVEYRASGEWRDEKNNVSRSKFYSFVVPTNIYKQAEDCQFVSYAGFNSKYAINSELNDKIKLQRIWYAGCVNGKFYEFNERENVEPDQNNHQQASSNMHSYWGNDVIVVQIKAGSMMDRAFNSKYAQLHFYDAAASNKVDCYSYLYQNNSYKYNENEYGSYIAIVPSDKVYSKYRLETVNMNNSTIVEYHSVEKGLNVDDHYGGDALDVCSATAADASGAHTSYLNTTYEEKEVTVSGQTVKQGSNRNVLTIDPGVRIYVGLSKGLYNDNAGVVNDSYYDPILHWRYNDSIDADGVQSDNNLGIASTFSYADSAGQNVYMCEGIPNGATIWFTWGHKIGGNDLQTDIHTEVGQGQEIWISRRNQTEIYLNKSNNTHTDQNSAESFFFARRWTSTEMTIKGSNNQNIPHYEP